MDTFVLGLGELAVQDSFFTEASEKVLIDNLYTFWTLMDIGCGWKKGLCHMKVMLKARV